MASFSVSTTGIELLQQEEALIDGLYDDMSGFATFGVGHLVHQVTKWNSFLLAAARSSEKWRAGLKTERGTTYVPRSVVGWADFAELKAKALELATAKFAQEKYGKSVDQLKGPEATTAKSLAESALRAELLLLPQTPESVRNGDLVPFQRAVNALVKDGLLNQDEFDALVSLAFNIGVGNLKSSTVLRLINEGKHLTGDATSRELAIRKIEEAFGMWCKTKGVIAPGLVKRRKAEADRFLKRARAELQAARVRQPMMRAVPFRTP